MSFLRASLVVRFVTVMCGLQVAPVVCAQDAPVTAAQTSCPAYNIVPYDEDWSFLKDRSERSDWLDPIKYMPFGGNGNSYASIGGEFRGTYERVLNDNWTNQPYPTNSFGLQRYLLHTDVHFNSQVRVFLELESGIEQGRPGGPRPVDEKLLDFLNIFIDFRPVKAASSPTIRVGRQELQLGSGRLVSVREGTNVRQSFYGFRVDQVLQAWRFTSFAVRPAIDRFGFFDDAPLSSTEFWGLVGSRSWSSSTVSFNGDYYGLDRKLATYNRGSAHEVRQTFSGNIVLDPPDKSDRRAELHLNAEGVLQVGSFGQQSIRAWSIATETGVSLPRLPRTPRIGLRADIASGDRGRNTPLGSFNPLFPAGNYFGVLADTGPGPVNFRDLHPKLILPVSKTVTLTPDWIFWWRQSLEDGVYSVPGTLIVPSGSSNARYVGNRPGVEARWQIDRHAYVQLSYGVFFAGPFLAQSGRDHNLNYLAYWLGYKF